MKFRIKEEFSFLFDALMKYASFFGSPFFIVFTLVFLCSFNQFDFAIRLAIMSAVFLTIEYTLKAITKDKRPDFKTNHPKSILGKFEEKHSFPSGHSGYVALLTTLINLNYHNLFLTLTFTIVTILVGMSRIYLKRHRIEDVVVGYLIGIALGVLSFFVF